jgi:serine/threonine-protein kinase
MADELAGQIVDRRFRVLAPLGRGAMARVYRALDLDTDREVALKIMRSELRDPVTRARFQREGEVQARIHHRNVAQLLATGVTPAGEPYLVVELLRGRTLREELKLAGTLPPARAASYAWQALQGLAAVHASGVLHRDLKPANMMLEPSPGPVPRLVLIDFGFAALEGGDKLTAPLLVVGSLRYIAPERLRDEAADQRADLYAVGAILYELITGVSAFGAADDRGMVDAHLHQVPELDPSIPAALAQVIATALAKQPADRYADAPAMAAAIELAARTL